MKTKQNTSKTNTKPMAKLKTGLKAGPCIHTVACKG